MADNTDDFVRSFGRTRGRKLKPTRDAAVENILPKLRIDLSSGELDYKSLFTNTSTELWFEIGFGGGEHLVEQARRHPEINFIGCEPYINGMATLLLSIEKQNIHNVRLYDGDARDLLTRLPDACVERMFILFPDPWPKVRHHKRRIINNKLLELIYKKLKANGLLRIATDHEDYCTWILAELLAFGKLAWTAKTAGDWSIAPIDWVETRYQSKALAEGRNATFLDLVKPALSL